MYRTLLATCGSAEMTHIYSVFDAANRYTSYLAIINTKISRSHTLQATCGTLPCNEYKHPTHTVRFSPQCTNLECQRFPFLSRISSATRARRSLTICREKTEIQGLETGKSLPRLGKSDHAAEKQHASSVEGRKNMWPPPTNTNQRIIQTSFVYDNLIS